MARHIHELLGDLPRRLSVPQVAELLGVGEPTVYRWLRDGEIPAYKVGSTWVILRDEVCDHLEVRHNRHGVEA
jgi:excisionase family DNA binding protein